MVEQRQEDKIESLETGLLTVPEVALGESDSGRGLSDRNRRYKEAEKGKRQNVRQGRIGGKSTEKER